MQFRGSGNPQAPIIILLHGGGLSNWSLQPIVDLLNTEFHVVTPIIDGHGEDWQETFLSIQDSAENLIRYIDEHCGGRVFAIGGLSLGAQIALDVLSRRTHITEFAILESVLVIPIAGMNYIAPPLYGLLYPLVKQRWFSELQAKSLLLPPEMYELYYRDSTKMSRASLTNIATSNAQFGLANDIMERVAGTSARALILAGGAEIGSIRKSATLLHQTIPRSKLHIAPRMKHGELSLVHPQEYVSLLRAFFSRGVETRQTGTE